MKKLLIITLTFLATTAFARVLTITPTQTQTQWQNTLNSLQPGDTLFLENGVFNNFQVDIPRDGTAENPIFIGARNPGSVFIEGAIAIRLGGDFVTVSGLHFRNGWGLSTNNNPNREAGLVFQFRIGTGQGAQMASNSRLTNSVFDTLYNPNNDLTDRDMDSWWVAFYRGQNNRVDHNFFGYKPDFGVMIFVDPREAGPNPDVQTSPRSYHILENNFFAPRPYLGQNGVEQLRIGDSDRSMFSVGMIVRNNVFYRNDGEIEIISIKSGDNILENNLVYESRGQFTFRHGDNNTIRNNVFIGNERSNSSGVRVINAGQRVYNNWFQGLRGVNNWAALNFQMGLDPSCPLNSFYQVDSALVAYNTFVNVQQINIGHNSNAQINNTHICGQNQNRLFRPINSTFRNNIVFHNFTAGALGSVVPLTVVARNANNLDMDEHERDAGITFEGNLFRINDNVSWTREGFSRRPTLHFVRPAGSMFYHIELLDNPTLNPGNCLPELTGRAGHPEIESRLDVTGQPRTAPFTAGAKNAENFSTPPQIPNLYEVGATWFRCIRTYYFSHYTIID